jgi:hypothetical protein
MARMERTEMHSGFLWDNLKEGYNLEDLDRGRRIIFKWIQKK